MGGRGSWISEFEASLVGLQGEFQDSQGYTEKPCLERQNKTKRPPTDWKRIFTYPKSDRGLISNIYKELKKFDYRKEITLLKNGV